MSKLAVTFALAGTVALAAPAAAQGRSDRDIPKEHRPPAGMCRIWIDGVPPGQQAAPTDCASAVRNRPSNGRVIFGDQPATNRVRPERDVMPPLRELVPVRRPALPKRKPEPKREPQREPERKPDGERSGA